MEKRFKKIILAFVLGLAAILPFGRTATFDLVNLDDYSYVESHEAVRSGLSAQTIFWSFSSLEESIWMPLTWISYAADWSIAKKYFDGDAVSAHHLMHAHSLGLHGLCAVLLFLLLCSWLRNGGERTWRVVVVAGLSALFWALHPLRCESVCWVASRKDVLSMAFLLLSLLAWTRFRTARMCISRETCYVLSVLALLGGCLCKPSVMLFPLFVVGYDVFVARHVRFEQKNLGWFRSVAPWVLPFLISAGVGLWAAYAQRAGGAMVATASIPLWAKVFNALVSLGLYAVFVVVPFALAPQRMLRYPDWPAHWALGLAVAALLAFVCIRRYKAWRQRGWIVSEPDWVSAGLLVFGFGLLPFLGIVGFGCHAMADRFTYIPALGVTFVLVGVLRQLTVGLLMKYALPLGGMLLIGLGCLSVRQSAIYRSNQTFWEHTRSVDGPQNAYANLGLAEEFFEENGPNCPEVVEHFTAVYDMWPSLMPSCGHLYVYALCATGNIQGAQNFLSFFEKWNETRNEKLQAAGIVPEGCNERYDALDLARIGYYISDPALWKVAEEDLARRLAAHPDDPHTLYLAGELAARQGKKDAARAHWRKIVSGEACDHGFIRYRFLKGKLEEGVK